MSQTWFIYRTFQCVSLTIFLWTQSDLNVGTKRRVEFWWFLWLAIFELFQIWTKHVRLEWITTYFSLFEIFVSNRPFICNHNQTINNKIGETFCKGLKRMWNFLRYIDQKIFKNLSFSRNHFLVFCYRTLSSEFWWKQLAGKTFKVTMTRQFALEIVTRFVFKQFMTQ